jgi:hypothetical protein
MKETNLKDNKKAAPTQMPPLDEKEAPTQMLPLARERTHPDTFLFFPPHINPPSAVEEGFEPPRCS